MKRIVCLSIAILAGSAAAASGSPVAACSATGGDEIRAAVPGPRVVIDPATRLAIRVEQPGNGILIISVGDTAASVRKELRNDRSVTTIRAGRHQVVIAIRGEEITVTDGTRIRRGLISKPEGLSAMFGEVGRLDAVRAGRDLLDRLALQADTLEGNALLLTRALLASSTGDRTSTLQHQQWARWKAGQPKVIRARSDLGPGECWDKYAAEAIRIMNDYIDCVKSCKWYELFCTDACGAIYDLRAEMAFMWYFNCNGPFYGG